MPQKNDTGLLKVRFSIGAKLITIITSIVLLSLSFIIIFASLLIRGDLQIMAEENNFETNRRSSIAAESSFENTLSGSMILVRTLSAINQNNDLADNTLAFFFERNPHIASVYYFTNDRENQVEVLTNFEFFSSREIDPISAVTYREKYRKELLDAAAGDIVLLNAAPYFSAPILAMFFSWGNGGACVLFEPADLSDSFGYGVNQSYLINNAGDILVHSDFSLVRGAENTRESVFTQYIFNNSLQSEQTLFTDENGTRYFGAFSKLEAAQAVVITTIEYDKIFEGINATTKRNFYLTITVLSISIILIWFFAKSISIPIKALASAAHEIEEGHFEIALQPKGRDEIGVLTDSFRRMTKALGIFGRFTNRDIALKAMRGEIKPGGLPKNATIFFSDIREFTSISETFTNVFGDEASDRIVHWLNRYFTRMIECVEKTKGDVDKFIGDAVMAHWGTAYTTGSTRKDAYNCVYTALMMRRALQKMNKLRDKEDPGSPRIRIGIGINTGKVTAGQLGSDVRMEYTVVGDPVNLASRVESLNKQFGTDILITENTWRLVRRRFITEEMPSVKVKGKEKPVRIFAVVNFAKNPKGPKSLIRLRRVLGIKDPGNLRMITVGPAGSTRIKYKFIKKK